MQTGLASTARSTIGAKALMAATGVVLLLFVLGHMAGNLQVFAGRETLNAYAAWIKGLGPGLWAIRLFLLTVLLLHVASAARVVRTNRAARPVPYAQRRDLATNYAARTMIWSGLLVLAFVVYHLMHFTFGWVDPAGAFHGVDDAGRHDVYGMVVAGFRHVPTTIAYAVAQVLLCLHIHHGASSLVQTLGLRNPRNARWADRAGGLLAALILVGNLSMPLAIVTGLVGD